MNQARNPLRRIVALTALAVVALAIVGCAKKVTNPDASYVLDPSYVTNPAHGGIEGMFSDKAKLVVYADEPIVVDSLVDLAPKASLGREDTLITSWTIRYAPEGTINGLVADGTAATAFQVLRRERNGGFALLQSYVINPADRMLETGWELYSFADERPSGYAPATYVGRGVVGGAVTRSSPLTNPGEIALSSVPNLVYTGVQAPADTNLEMSWRAVDGAAGYWVQVYQYPSVSMSILKTVSRPAPLALQFVRNNFVAYLPGNVTAYKIGDPLPPGAYVLTKRPLISKRSYFVRVAAVNAAGEMIAFTYGSGWFTAGVNGWYVGWTGAVFVQPGGGDARTVSNVSFGPARGAS